MTKYRTFRVRLAMPPDAEVTDVVDYINSAVQSWRGQLRPPGGYCESDPGDPMWELDVETVTVQAYKPPKNRRKKS
jgi:hypothetical protein